MYIYIGLVVCSGGLLCSESEFLVRVHTHTHTHTLAYATTGTNDGWPESAGPAHL